MKLYLLHWTCIQGLVSHLCRGMLQGTGMIISESIQELGDHTAYGAKFTALIQYFSAFQMSRLFESCQNIELVLAL